MSEVNGLRAMRDSYNELSFMVRSSLPPDPIGYNPTLNQAEQGTPRWSGWGALLRLTPKSGYRFDASMQQTSEAAMYPAGDYFPSYPFRGIHDFTGRQTYGARPSEMLYAQLHGYRGILPINQLPIINRPYPYQIPVYEQFGR